jgi:hypothetical protein
MSVRNDGVRSLQIKMLPQQRHGGAAMHDDGVARVKKNLPRLVFQIVVDLFMRI